MKSPDRRLARLLSLARRAPPPGRPPTPENVRFFAQGTVSAWKRQRTAGATFDPWRLWERVGNGSLAAVTALVMIVIPQPEPPPPPANPFDAFGPVEVEELNLF